MQLSQTPQDIISNVRDIWTASFDYFMKLLPMVLLFMAAFGLLCVAGIALVGGFALFHMAFFTIISYVIFALLFLLLFGFFTAALLLRGWAYLSNNPELIARSWHYAENKAVNVIVALILYYFLIFLIQLAFLGIDMLLPFKAVQLLTSILEFIIVTYLVILPILFLPAIVIDNFSVMGGIKEALRISKGHWWRTMIIVSLSSFLFGLFWALIFLISWLLVGLWLAVFFSVFLAIGNYILMVFSYLIVYHDLKLRQGVTVIQ